MRLAILLFCSCLVWAQEDVRDLVEKKALERIAHIDRSTDGALGVAAIDLETGRTLSYHGTTVFPTASAIKVPVMIEVFRQAAAGRFRLDQDVALSPSDLVDGSTRLAVLLRKGPASASIRELVAAMIQVSDNTAANQLIGLAGMDQVNRTLDELGFPQTRLRRKMMDWVDTDRRENISTPLEMARLMQAIYSGKAAAAPDCAEMLRIMKSVEADLRGVVPAAVEVASKPGEIPGARCETGIVFLPKRPFAVAIMSSFLPRGRNPVPEAASVLYSLFESLANSNRYGHRLQ